VSRDFSAEFLENPSQCSISLQNSPNGQGLLAGLVRRNAFEPLAFQIIHGAKALADMRARKDRAPNRMRGARFAPGTPHLDTDREMQAMPTRRAIAAGHDVAARHLPELRGLCKAALSTRFEVIEPQRLAKIIRAESFAGASTQAAR